MSVNNIDIDRMIAYASQLLYSNIGSKKGRNFVLL